MENLKQEAEELMLSWTEIREFVAPLSWRSPPSTLTLTSNDVHVWLAKLDSPAMRVQKMAQCLIEDERKRAERFNFRRDRKRFIVARGVLRMILSRYLHIEPNRVQFSYGPHGKPYLAERLGDGALRFNLAHSHEFALYAFTLGREIGVDIEYLRALPDADQIAKRFFSARENAALQALSTNQRQQAFYNCWTRKEAYVKAIGKGLAQPLDQIEVSLAPGESARLLKIEGTREEGSRWSLYSLTPVAGYVAAVAVCN